jgi:DUF4097 and DUF4098 domain-containing protein YvlB
MPSDPWGARGGANTAPTSTPNTRPVYMPPAPHQPPSSYPQTPAFQQRPPLPVPQGAMPAYVPPRSSTTSWVLIIVVLVLTVLGGIIIGGRTLARRFRERVIDSTSQGPRTSTRASTETKTFTLNANAAVSLKTISGDISVESWDQPQAEVKIIGNSGSDNNQSSLATKNENGNLSLEALPGSGGADIRFVVKLPHNVGQVTLNSASGSIKVSKIDGQLTINTASGDITMSDIKGPIAIITASGRIKLSNTKGVTTVKSASGDITLDDISSLERVDTASGNIKVSLSGESLERPLSLKSVSGSIELNLEPGFNATLDASTRTGSISMDESINIQVQNSSPTGQRASGPIGKGGQPISISTVSDNIEINQ